MNPSREAEELVQLWQQLQEAQVAGDVQRLASLHRLAEAQSRRAGASGEWELLAREAGRHTARVHEQAEAQPRAGVGAGAPVAQYEPVEEPRVDEVSAPEAATEPADEARAGSRGRGLAPIIWLVIIVGYLVLQVIGRLAGGDGPQP